MLNSYGYNRKTKEQDDAILGAVKLHHEKVKKELEKLDIYCVVMTSLVGSQNYDLDDEHSDVDTFTFFFPKIEDFFTDAAEHTYEFNMPDGKCYVKDIRKAFNLLKKTSPNSAEYFLSKYKYYDPAFKSVLEYYLDKHEFLYPMVHCNYRHMLEAIAGMARQLTSRNMPAGKRYAHALRLMAMRYHFIESVNAASILEMRPGGDVELALSVKRDEDKTHWSKYNEECGEIDTWLYNYSKAYELSESEKKIEITGKMLIFSIQEDLFKRYIALNKNNLVETIN